MALVSSSVQITGLDATPVTKLNTSYFGGSVRSTTGYIAAANLVGGTVGQWYTFCRLPQRARIVAVRASNAGTSTGAFKVGLYRTAANGGAAVKNDNLAAIFPLAGGSNNRVRIDTAMTALQTSQIMSDAFATEIGTAGATADVNFDIVLTVLTVVSAAVDIAVDVDFVLND